MRVVKSAAVAVLILSAAILAGCSPASNPVPSPSATPSPTRATVTDLSVPFDSNEADALVPRGFMGSGSLGRLGMGCLLDVIKTTDRAVQVKIASCPADEKTTVPASARSTLQGWVAKSALDLR